MSDYTIFEGDRVNAQATEGDARRALPSVRSKRQSWLFATWPCPKCHTTNRGGEHCRDCGYERPVPDYAK